MADTAPAGSSLAARCTACSTVFRVVPDQLRVSEGWVRCGRCSQVFNAAENLIDLDTGVPRRLELGGPLAPLVPLAAPAPAALARPAAADEPAPESSIEDTAMAATLPLYGPAGPRPQPEAPAGHEAGPGNAGFPARAAEPQGSAPAAVAAEAGETAPVTESTPSAVATSADLADLAAPAGFAAQSTPDTASPDVSAEPAPAGPADTAAAAAGTAAALPSFVRRADRAARWRQPRVRAALGGASALAALLLAGQMVFTYRDLAAARWPELRPTLEAACGLLGCRVGPAQAIESLTVEASSLLRVEQTRLYQLTVGLRNRAAMDLAVPALELSLTDAQGRLLARRVLRAADLGVSQPTVAAGRDLALQATLQTAPLSTDGSDAAVVVGYTIELFYP